jgi:hypothetical protein
MTRQDKALDTAEWVFGVPLFIVVSALTAAVMAVGLGGMAALGRVFR